MDEALAADCTAALEEKDEEALIKAFEALPPDLVAQAADALRIEGSEVSATKH